MHSSTVRVWDLPLRLFHWSLALLTVAAFLTSRGDDWSRWHNRIGLAIAVLLVFRLLWGIVGSVTARFASFVRAPRDVLAYLWRTPTQMPAVPGHNPAGGWMVLLLLLVYLAQCLSGLYADDDINWHGPLATRAAADWIRAMVRLHEWNFRLILALLALHLGAIGFYQLVKKINLIGPMLHGMQRRAVAPHPPATPGELVRAGVCVALACLLVWLIC